MIYISIHNQSWFITRFIRWILVSDDIHTANLQVRDKINKYHYSGCLMSYVLCSRYRSAMIYDPNLLQAVNINFTKHGLVYHYGIWRDLCIINQPHSPPIQQAGCNQYFNPKRSKYRSLMYHVQLLVILRQPSVQWPQRRKNMM